MKNIKENEAKNLKQSLFSSETGFKLNAPKYLEEIVKNNEISMKSVCSTILLIFKNKPKETAISFWLCLSFLKNAMELNNEIFRRLVESNLLGVLEDFVKWPLHSSDESGKFFFSKTDEKLFEIGKNFYLFLLECLKHWATTFKTDLDLPFQDSKLLILYRKLENLGIIFPKMLKNFPGKDSSVLSSHNDLQTHKEVKIEKSAFHSNSNVNEKDTKIERKSSASKSSELLNNVAKNKEIYQNFLLKNLQETKETKEKLKSASSPLFDVKDECGRMIAEMMDDASPNSPEILQGLLREQEFLVVASQIYSRYVKKELTYDEFREATLKDLRLAKEKSDPDFAVKRAEIQPVEKEDFFHPEPNSSSHRNNKLEVPLTSEEQRPDKDTDLMNLLSKIDSDDEKRKPVKVVSLIEPVPENDELQTRSQFTKTSPKREKPTEPASGTLKTGMSKTGNQLGYSSTYRKIQTDHLQNTEFLRNLETENENLKRENLLLRSENAALAENVTALEAEVAELKKRESAKTHHSNKRENFVDVQGFIIQVKDLKALNAQLTGNLEDLKRENEIILEDFRRIQVNFEELQAKNTEILAENTQLKNSIYKISNINQREVKTAAEPPRFFFEKTEKTPAEEKWSENLFMVKKTEFPSEFVRRKLGNESVIGDNVQRGRDLRLSNYKEAEEGSMSFNKKDGEMDARTFKTVYSKNLGRSGADNILENSTNNEKISNYSLQRDKKVSDPELLFPYKRKMDYFETKNETLIKGKVVELNAAAFKELEGMRNLDEFKLSCLKGKTSLFSNEVFEIVAVQTSNIIRNNTFKFVLAFKNFGRNYIENLVVKFIADESTLSFSLNPNFLAQNLKPQSELKQELLIFLKRMPYNFLRLRFSLNSNEKNIECERFLPMPIIRAFEWKSIQIANFKTKWREGKKLILRSQCFKMNKSVLKSGFELKDYFQKLIELNNHEREIEYLSGNAYFKLGGYFSLFEQRPNFLIKFVLTPGRKMAVQLLNEDLGKNEEIMNYILGTMVFLLS